MKASKNVVVYVRAEDAKMLERQQKDPAEWIRGLVRHALDTMRQREEPDERV